MQACVWNIGEAVIITDEISQRSDKNMLKDTSSGLVKTLVVITRFLIFVCFHAWFSTFATFSSAVQFQQDATIVSCTGVKASGRGGFFIKDSCTKQSEICVLVIVTTKTSTCTSFSNHAKTPKTQCCVTFPSVTQFGLCVACQSVDSGGGAGHRAVRLEIAPRGQCRARTWRWSDWAQVTTSCPPRFAGRFKCPKTESLPMVSSSPSPEENILTQPAAVALQRKPSWRRELGPAPQNGYKSKGLHPWKEANYKMMENMHNNV